MKTSLIKKLAFVGAAVAALSAASVASASTSIYNITTTWYEPDTQPKNTIFNGTFTYDSITHAVTNLQGQLSESMTGMGAGDMTWLTLSNQLVTWHDNALHGTFAATFKNANTNTFTTAFGGDGWSPTAGIDAGGAYYGYPKPSKNPYNAYALIFVPDAPLTPLTQGQIIKLAYADCAPGGMMGATCMTGTSDVGYGSVGTMSGYPVSQTITAAVPEPETYGMLLAGLGLMAAVARRRRVR